MLEELTKESEKVGLLMNAEKTKIMTNRTKETITVRENTIEYVDEYIYLGQIISPSNLMAKEIDKRVANAWKRYWSLKEVMKNEELAMRVKSKLFNSCILPILTYGCQTWALTNAHLNKLKVCQRSMERSMVGVKRKDREKTKM